MDTGRFVVTIGRRSRYLDGMEALQKAGRSKPDENNCRYAINAR